MFRKMKLVIFGILFASIITSNLKALARNSVENQETIFRAQSTALDFYYAFDDWFYSYSPVHYTYTPTFYYYLCEWWWFPSACDTTYIVWRQKELNTKKDDNTNNKEEKKEFNLDEAQKQIKQLKKEIFGKEEYSTEEIRKNHKAYDPRWLLAQLKISRILFLEDELKSRNSKSSTSDSIKIQKRTETKETK